MEGIATLYKNELPCCHDNIGAHKSPFSTTTNLLLHSLLQYGLCVVAFYFILFKSVVLMKSSSSLMMVAMALPSLLTISHENVLHTC